MRGSANHDRLGRGVVYSVAEEATTRHCPTKPLNLDKKGSMERAYR